MEPCSAGVVLHSIFACSTRPRIGRREIRGLLESAKIQEGVELGSRAQLSPVSTARRLRAAVGDEPEVIDAQNDGR